jgi:acyl carrier protein
MLRADDQRGSSLNEQSIRDALLAVLRTIAPEVTSDAIVADRPLRDQVDLDSMDFLNFLIRVQEKLGVDVPEADYAKLITLNDFVAYVAARRHRTPGGTNA